MPSDDKLPIATATVARLCLAQGRLAQAEALYRDLLARSPDDPRLQEGLAEVLRRKAHERPLPQGTTLEVTLEGSRLRCRWSVTEEAQNRAQLVLDEAGQLVLRLVGFAGPDEHPPVDTPLTQPAGTVDLPAPERSPVVAAAVGLKDRGGQFVSIVHAKPLRMASQKRPAPSAARA